MAYENRDYTHLSENEKQKIELIAQAIRNKAYGIDVRESIALAIEWVNREYQLTIENNILTLKEFENAKAKVSTLESDMDEFIQRYSEQIAGNTSLDETIDARVDATGVSHTTLKDRLDKENQEVTAQLAHISLNVLNYGAKGDGVSDDTNAINQLLLGGKKTIYLPYTGKPYMISEPLVVDSYTTILLADGAEIKLATGANCPMIKNRNQSGSISDTTIKIEGGIWNHNRNFQVRDDNQSQGAGDPFTTWFGIMFQFCDVQNIKILNLTLKDPVSWSCFLGNVSHFEVRNIFLDFGAKPPINTDGIHLSGAAWGVIDNIYGTTGDDMIALNADDYGVYRLREGDIHDITVSNVFGVNGYRGIRFLTNHSAIYNVTLSKVYGKYYNDVILFSRPSGATGPCNFYNITIENIYAIPDKRCFVINFNANVESVSINNVHRVQNQVDSSVVYGQNFIVQAGWIIDKLQITNTKFCDNTFEGLSEITVYGTVKSLIISDAHHYREKAEYRKGRFIDVRSGGSISSLIMNNIDAYRVDTFIYNDGTIKKINLNQSIVVCSTFLSNKGDINEALLNNINFACFSYFMNIDLPEGNSFGRMDVLMNNLIKDTLYSENPPIYLKNASLLVKTQNVNGLSYSADNKINSTLRIIGLDLIVDKNILNPTTGDMVRDLNTGSSPIFYDGTKWVNIITGQLI